jgi:hypothetical protein
MIHYYIGIVSSDEAGQHNQLYAEIDEQYYWLIEWTTNNAPPSSVIRNWHCGLLTETERPASVTEISTDELRRQFGSFAHYLERSISGFKSYVAWMAPDPFSDEVRWK